MQGGARNGLEQLIAPRTGATPPSRLATAPERVSGFPAGVIVLATVVLTVLAVTDGRTALPPTLGMGILVGLAVLAAVLGSPPALHVTLLCVLAVLAHLLPGSGVHPFPLATALAAYAVVVFARQDLRESTGWLHSGATDAGTGYVGGLTALAASAVLVLWYGLSSPSLEEPRAAFEQVPTILLPPMALFFALVNAGVEELTFRGVLLDGLRSAVGDVGGVALQAAAFGLAHYATGIPDGLVGAVLAGCYGLALGVVRLRAGGLIAVWSIHASTDLVIVLLIVVAPP